MKRFLALTILATLLLTACGSSGETDGGGSLGSMFGSDSDDVESGDDAGSPEDVPYSNGPTEIPPELVPHE